VTERPKLQVVAEVLLSKPRPFESNWHAPWHVVAANHKWHARVTVCETAVNALGEALECDAKLPKGWRALDQ